MTRPQDMPIFIDVTARWDRALRRVRYYGLLENNDSVAPEEWVEIEPEDFANLAREEALGSVSVVAAKTMEVIDRAKKLLDEVGDLGKFIQGMQQAMQKRDEN